MCVLSFKKSDNNRNVLLTPNDNLELLSDSSGELAQKLKSGVGGGGLMHLPPIYTVPVLVHHHALS